MTIYEGRGTGPEFVKRIARMRHDGGTVVEIPADALSNDNWLERIVNTALERFASTDGVA
jgi:hypothetical protein